MGTEASVKLIPKPSIYRFEGRRLSMTPKHHFAIYPEMRCVVSAPPGGLRAGTIAAMKEDFVHMTGWEIPIELKASNGGVFLASIGRAPSVMPETMDFVVPDKDESYAIYIGGENIELASGGMRGFFWGWQTVCQLASQPSFPSGTIEDAPAVPLRAMHLDLKGMMPKYEVLAELIKNFSRHKINAILLEYEDKIKYDTHPKIAHPTLSLSKKQYATLIQLAHDRGIQVIPKLQCLGHLDYLLMHGEYRGIREADGLNTYQLCPSNDRSFMVWKDMAEELLELHRDDLLFHIGADEVDHNYECAFCKDKDRFKLYVAHLHKVADFLRAEGKEVLAWDDVFRNHDPDESMGLLKKIVPVVWQYGPVVELYAARMARQGIPFIGASAASASSAQSSEFPNVESHLMNMNNWAEIAGRRGVKGIIATAWSRMQCRTPAQHFLPVSYYQILFHAETAWRAEAVDADEFDVRFPQVFFGVDSPMLGCAPRFFHKDPRLVDAYLRPFPGQVRRNKEVLEIWDVMNKISMTLNYIESCFSFNKEFLPSYRRKVPWNIKKNYLDGVRISREKIQDTIKEVERILPKYMEQDQIKEILETRFDGVSWLNDQWEKIINESQIF